MITKPNWIHIIGICGSATSAIAVMFKNLGVKVTGSDKGFFPPVSDYLKHQGLEVQIGFKPEHLTDKSGSHPDIVLVQGAKGLNPEIAEAQKLGLKLTTFPELLRDFVVTSNSIVVAGTYGKTTITSALVDIFDLAEKEISYMFGGVKVDFGVNAKAKTENTKYSIIEGDEYMTSLDKPVSKFFYYNPKYLLLNSVSYEHPDLFKTELEYKINFSRLAEGIPENGLIVANANDKNVVEVIGSAKCKIVFYSVDRDKAVITPDWFLEKSSTPLPTFIKWNQENGDLEVIPYERKVIGEFNEENLLAAAVLASELGIKKERIQDAIANFTGIKRRLELKLQTEKLMVIDDFGSSPPKAEGSLKSLREDYPESKIIAVFEPNTGNRTQESIPTYQNAFVKADQIVFPRFTKLPKTELTRMDEQELANALPQYYPEIKVIPDDKELIELLLKAVENESKHLIIVFMGSHGFRGMIDQLVESLKLKVRD